MIRIRHFEDKCAELYTQQKIRGFLHLYDGEEAIAVGVIPVLGETTASSPPTASTAMRWPAACR
jgi:TPP-dependent pyruvate/acetoin dehydrogenase alpha subunit